MLGKHHSKETKQRMSCSLLNRVISEEERAKKSLLVKGENNPCAKLIWEQVREIREKYIPYKYSSCKLAKEYGVSEEAIRRIVNNLTWKEEIIEDNKDIIEEKEECLLSDI